MEKTEVMEVMKILINVCLALCVLTTSAKSGVVYNWVEDSPSNIGVTFTAWIEFDESVFLNGGFNASLDTETECIGETQSPFCSSIPFDFSFTATLDGAGSAFLGGVEDLFYQGPLETEFNMEISTFGDLLVGSFYAGESDDSDIHFFTETDENGLATMTLLPFVDTPGLRTPCNTNADWEAPLEEQPCGGATGRWVLDRSTIPRVPAPAPISLFIMGLVGLTCFRRNAGT